MSDLNPQEKELLAQLQRAAQIHEGSVIIQLLIHTDGFQILENKGRTMKKEEGE